MKKLQSKNIKAWAIVGCVSGGLYMNEQGVGYQVWFDGFMAENELARLRECGLKCEIVECTISYTITNKKKK